jgi:hypothetical protein
VVVSLHRLLPICLVAAVLAVPATASATPLEVRVTEGTVTATLRGDAQERLDRSLLGVGRTTLEIARAGQGVRPEAPVAACRPDCGERDSLAGASVYVADLDADGEPEVVVDRWLSGTVCCTGSTTVHRYADGAYVPVAPKRLGSHYRVRDLDADGTPEIVSNDHRFFTRFAPRVFGAYLPIRIHAYAAGRFTVVTREHRPAVEQDRAALLAVLEKHQARLDRGIRSRGENRGVIRAVLPALLADDRLLGEREVAAERLRDAVRRGDVSRRYARRVRAFLRDAGY